MRGEMLLYGGMCVLAVALFTLVHMEVRMREEVLRVVFLDVGQGDAIFIESPSGAQMLIDGGKDQSVLRELSAVMPWWDRSIDVVMATHPDADHVGGLFEVLSRYTVFTALHPGVNHDTPYTESLFEAFAREKNSGMREVLARRGQVISLGDGVRVEILFPDRDVSGVETNTASVVARVVYGDTALMLTGDAPRAIEEYLASLDRDMLSADVLKAGHHGSDTSSSPLFVGSVAPTHVVFSRGCDNSYGHPHPDTRATMERFGIRTYDTCTEGRVVFESDGTQILAK